MRSGKRRWPDTKPVLNTPQARAVAEAGGVLLGVNLKTLPEGRNGGCGAPTFVAGTNGGKMPCGGTLTWPNGKKTVEYCAPCAEQREILKRAEAYSLFVGSPAHMCAVVDSAGKHCYGTVAHHVQKAGVSVPLCDDCHRSWMLGAWREKEPHGG